MNGRNENNRILRRPIHHGPFSRGAKKKGKISSATLGQQGKYLKELLLHQSEYFINESGGNKKKKALHSSRRLIAHVKRVIVATVVAWTLVSNIFFSIGRPLHCDCLICMFSPSDDLYNVLPPLVRPYNSAISTHGRCHGNRPCSLDFGKRDGRRFELTDLIKLF